MFTVKATYRGQIRKLTFSGSNFPSFEELRNQLSRFFPSIQNYYLSRLLLSPDASLSSRILIGQEVRTAEDYERCIMHHNNRLWTNALLRFTVSDVPNEPACFAPEASPAQPMSDIWSSQGCITGASLRYIGASDVQPSPFLRHIPPPPPPPVFPTPPRAFTQTPTNAESPPLISFMPSHCSFPSESRQSHPTLDERSTTSCCSIAQGKAEIQDLISDFQRNLDATLTRTFGAQSTASTQNAQLNQALPPPPPPVNQPFWLLPVLCVSCQKNVAALRQFTCDNCRTILCFECYVSGKSEFCTSSMGPHFMKESTLNMTPPSMSVPSNPWIPPVPRNTSCQWMPPVTYVPSPFVAPPVTYVPSSYVTPGVPFVPPPPSAGSHATAPTGSNWSHMRSPSPVIPPSVTVTPAPASVRIRTPSPRPLIHHGVLCDSCDKVVEGVRHKCLDCHNYDLCTTCISTGSAERHNPFHEFFEINEPVRVIVHTVNAPDRGPVSNNEHALAPGPVPAVDTTVIHAARCDLCDSRIEGHRYKCAVCPDFDTCSSCFCITEEQHPNHSFIKLSKVDDYIQRDSTSPPRHNATCDACNNQIIGVRFKCTHPDCPDFDLCEACEAHPIPVHPDKHAMLKIKSIDTTIPTIQDTRERPEPRICVPERPYDYDGGYMYNPSVSSTEFPSHSRSPMPQVPTPDEVRSMTPPFIPYHPPIPSFPEDHQFYSPQYVHPGRCYPYRSPSITPCIISPVSPYMPSVYGPPSPYTHLSTPGSVEPFDPSPCSSGPGSPIHPASLVWQSACESVGKEAALDVKNSPPVATTWMPSARDLDHLINGQAFSTAKSPSDGNTPFLSPLGNEALLTRPGSMKVPEPTDVVPVSAANRSLAALLDDYGSTESNEASSLATSIVEGVQKGLTAGIVADITIPDGQNFPPGAEFVKCWRMINDGERDWPESTELVFVAGIPLLKESSAQNVRIGAVKAGSEVDLWTGELKAPEVPGRYIGYWRLRDDQGQLFGNTIWVEINVVEDASEGSLASSTIIMPKMGGNRTEGLRVPGSTAGSSVTAFTNMRGNSDSDGESDASSVSLVSETFSEEEWVEEAEGENVEYVLLYDDDNTSEED